MQWLDAVNARAKRKNKVLFMPGDALFDALSPLTERADRRALVLWALSLADDAVSRLRALLPEETRPMDAVRLARQWSRGEVKMPVAKSAILACHAVARENVSPEAAEGGPIALVEEGDLIQVDIPGRVLRICGIQGKELPEEEIAAALERRRAAWQPRPPRYQTGILGLFTRSAASPMEGGTMD